MHARPYSLKIFLISNYRYSGKGPRGCVDATSCIAYRKTARQNVSVSAYREMYTVVYFLDSSHTPSYMYLLVVFSGYLNEGGTLNLVRFQKYLDVLAEVRLTFQLPLSV